MADQPIIPTAKKYNYWIRIVLLILGIGVLFALVVFIYNITRVNWKQIKLLISQDSASFKNPASTEKILLAGAHEIVYNPHLFKQAREYAKANGIPIERVVVNNALALSKQMNFISE